MNRGITLCLCLLAGLASVRAAGKWSYVGKTGPLYWHELFPEACGGKNQSPIDLRPEQTMYNPDLKEFAIWYDPPMPDSKMYIKNTGYTVQVDLEGDFYVTNAGLGHVYKAAQFHFHWGHHAHQGSEHTVQGDPSPLELHVVTYNHDMYSGLGEAVMQPGGLAVLGTLFELTDVDNPNFDYIIRGMRQIRNPEKVTKVELPLFSMRSLMPHDISRYYRYNGSLTTPGCFETVTWSVFDEKQTISHRQMDEFRKMLQFKRKHHKHHKNNGDNNDHRHKNAGDNNDHRHKRELSDAERQKEHNAKEVLNELGIHSKDSAFEREVLKEQLINAKADVNGVAQPDTRSVTEGANIVVQKDPMEPTYSQDYIVNNFRPVQPINGRIVYRSFKLREVIMVDEHGSPVYTQKFAYDTHSGHHDNSKHHGDGGASGMNVSVMTLLTIMSIVTFVAKLLR